jgi:hypothetical protein
MQDSDDYQEAMGLSRNALFQGNLRDCLDEKVLGLRPNIL